MRIEAARANQEDEVLARLVDAGERLSEQVAGEIHCRGHAVVPALIEILEDEELGRQDALGGGYAPIHAAKLLKRLEAPDAIAPMLRVLARCDPMDILYGTLVDALESLGAPVLEPALAAYAAAESEDHRAAIANVLSGLGVRDDRILPVLLAALNDDVVLGALDSASAAWWAWPRCPAGSRSLPAPRCHERDLGAFPAITSRATLTSARRAGETCARLGSSTTSRRSASAWPLPSSAAAQRPARAAMCAG
jgi:hypothetical protein